MPGLLDDLVAVLGAEAAEYRDLLPILEEERRALVRADGATLLDLGEKRMASVLSLAALERKRHAAVGALASALGIPPSAVTLSRLLDLVPGPAAALSPLRAELRDLLGRLLLQNGRNRFLAEHTLGCLQGLFSSLVAVLAPPPTYADSGRAGQPAQELRLLDRRA